MDKIYAYQFFSNPWCDEEPTVIYSDVKYSPEEFTRMYNSILDNLRDIKKPNTIFWLVSKFEELYGFFTIEDPYITIKFENENNLRKIQDEELPPIKHNRYVFNIPETYSRGTIIRNQLDIRSMDKRFTVACAIAMVTRYLGEDKMQSDLAREMVHELTKGYDLLKEEWVGY